MTSAIVAGERRGKDTYLTHARAHLSLNINQRQSHSCYFRTLQMSLHATT